MRTTGFGQFDLPSYSHSFLLSPVEEKQGILPSASPLLSILPPLSSRRLWAPGTYVAQDSGWSPWPSSLRPKAPPPSAPSLSCVYLYSPLISFQLYGPQQHSSLSRREWPDRPRASLLPRRCFKAATTNQGTPGAAGSIGLQGLCPARSWPQSNLAQESLA